MALFDSGTPLANVIVTDTFDNWRIRTNQIIEQAAGLASNNTFTGTLNTFNNTASFKGPVTAPIITANSINGTAANFTTLQADAIDFDGDLTVDNVAANTLAGTLSTAAQPNITSTGTLTSLTIAGSMTAANADFSGPVTAAIVTANSFVGDGSGLTNAGSTVAIKSDDVDYKVTFTNQLSEAHANTFVNGSFLFNPSTGECSATNFNSTSDILYKDNIEEISDASSIISKIKGFSFNWKHSGKKSYGVVAQEIEKVLPDIVVNNDNGKAVNYNTLIAFLIESNKELQNRINTLENKIK